MNLECERHTCSNRTNRCRDFPLCGFCSKAGGNSTLPLALPPAFLLFLAIASVLRYAMPEAFINRIATANPPHDVHDAFLGFGRAMLRGDKRRQALFGRMAERSGISHRYSFIKPDPNGAVTDVDGFYRPGNFPDTAARMRKYEAWAPGLAVAAVEELLAGEDRSRITHIIVTSCTGFSAPGIDLALVERCGLSPSVERTMVG